MTGILDRRRERKGERWAPFRHLSKQIILETRGECASDDAAF